MDPQFEELARRVATEVIEQFEAQFKRQMHEFEGR